MQGLTAKSVPSIITLSHNAAVCRLAASLHLLHLDYGAEQLQACCCPTCTLHSRLVRPDTLCTGYARYASPAALARLTAALPIARHLQT